MSTGSVKSVLMKENLPIINHFQEERRNYKLVKKKDKTK